MKPDYSEALSTSGHKQRCTISRFSDADFTERLREVTAPYCSIVIEQRTRVIVDDASMRRDAALLELTERFDGAKLAEDQIVVLPSNCRAREDWV